MPNFDGTGPRGQGKTEKIVESCRSDVPMDNRGGNFSSGGMGRRIRGNSSRGNDLKRCSARQGQCQNRRRGHL